MRGRRTTSRSVDSWETIQLASRKVGSFSLDFSLMLIRVVLTFLGDADLLLFDLRKFSLRRYGNLVWITLAGFVHGVRVAAVLSVVQVST